MKSMIQVMPRLSRRTSELKMQAKNGFIGTTTPVGFLSWVMPRGAFLVTWGWHRLLAKQKGTHQVSERGMCLSPGAGAPGGRSVLHISTSSWKVRTRFTWKQWGTMIALIIPCRLKRLPWTSWKSSHHLFQVRNNERTSKLFNYKAVIIWGTACT